MLIWMHNGRREPCLHGGNLSHAWLDDGFIQFAMELVTSLASRTPGLTPRCRCTLLRLKSPGGSTSISRCVSGVIGPRIPRGEEYASIRTCGWALDVGRRAWISMLTCVLTWTHACVPISRRISAELVCNSLRFHRETRARNAVHVELIALSNIYIYILFVGCFCVMQVFWTACVAD